MKLEKVTPVVALIATLISIYLGIYQIREIRKNKKEA